MLFYKGIFFKMAKKINATDCVLLFFAYICFDYKLLFVSFFLTEKQIIGQ